VKAKHGQMHVMARAARLVTGPNAKYLDNLRYRPHPKPTRFQYLLKATAVQNSPFLQRLISNEVDLFRRYNQISCCPAFRRQGE